jgi:hypothetical protein
MFSDSKLMAAKGGGKAAHTAGWQNGVSYHPLSVISEMKECHID